MFSHYLRHCNLPNRLPGMKQNISLQVLGEFSSNCIKYLLITLSNTFAFKDLELHWPQNIDHALLVQWWQMLNSTSDPQTSFFVWIFLCKESSFKPSFLMLTKGTAWRRGPHIIHLNISSPLCLTHKRHFLLVKRFCIFCEWDIRYWVLASISTSFFCSSHPVLEGMESWKQ